MHADTSSNRDLWPEAMATVTSCRYDAGIGRALAFGIPTTRHFRIVFNYWAPGPDGADQLHTAELTAAKPIPQGSLFPIRYNPSAPQEIAQGTHEASPLPLGRSALFAIGIIGSVILSLAWLIILRGC